INIQGFLVDGSIVVEAKIVVRGENRERFRKKRTQFDFFSPSKYSNIIFSVDGKKLHVSKQDLANVSPYFESLLFGDFKESQANEIVLEDVSVKEFTTTLKLIYDIGKVDESNAEYLLKMADRFDIP
ncbi:hypothetical protein PENTCL1PPCAC_23516, partial [Pristionchus entomophagus]